MKENLNINVKESTEKIVKVDKQGRIYNIGVFIQIVLLIVFVDLLIMSIFLPKIYVVSQFVLSFLLFVMAYNNYNIYKRKGMTIIYIIIGLLLLVTQIIKIYG